MAGFILRPNHALDRPFKTIAVCKYKGMGSIVQATPLLQTLKASYPEARIIFITTPANVAIIQKTGLCHEIIVIRDKSIFTLLSSIFKALGRMWKLRIQVYFDLEIYSHFSSLMTTLSMARNRFGFYLRSGNYRMGIYTHMMFYNIKAPVSSVYLQMASMLPLKKVITDLYNLNQDKEQIKGERPQKYLVINPNASDLRVERRWPAENFIQLIRILLEKTPYQITFIGSRSEQEYVEQIAKNFKENSRVINKAGQTGFDELITTISQAEAMITNDTGPMHLAFSVRCPVVALFGPCSPAQYGQGGVTIPLYKNLYCSPCVHEFIVPPCKGNNTCMKEIQVEEVFNALEMALSGDFKKSEIEKVMYLSKDTSIVAGKVVR
ncbi:MAG: hypothetical protein CVU05_12585 [Bacteroidetes bacterium HGW-Bacteroidetes-21]|nr:MAG: hypothetical protein CVU05_12585 [Bacteroidetes bacterium HGW-Bacteroidetes-21]